MSDSTTVALVTPWNRTGGIANYSARLAEELEVQGATVEPVPICESESSNPLHYGQLVNRIPDDADIVHVQFEAGLFGRLGMSGVGAPWFFYRLRALKQPVVTTLHEVHAEHHHRGVVGDYLLRGRDTVIERLAIAASDRIIVHSRKNERTLEERHGTDIGVRRHLLPPEREKEPAPADDAKARFGLSGHVLLTLGWIEPKKQFVDVIRALPELPYVTYLVVGDPRPGHEDAFETARATAEELGVSNRVVRHEYIPVEELDTLFAAADAVVLPYRRVSVSIAINEALSYGLPTVASSLPYFEELREGYDCLLTYETQAELESALDAVVNDERTRESLESAAAKYVNEVNWTTFAEWTRELYDAQLR